MCNTYHHRGQRSTKRRKLDQIFSKHATKRRKERWPEQPQDILLSAWTGLSGVVEPSFNEPQDYIYVAMGAGIRISHMDQVRYVADDHSPNCVLVFRRNAFVMEG